MTQNTIQANQQNQQDRQTQIANLILTERLTHEQVAQQLGISRSTVERDLTAWLNSPAWTTWLTKKWATLCKELELSGDKLDKREVLRSITQLLKRGGVEVNLTKVELTKVEAEVNILLKDYEQLISLASKPKPLTDSGTPTQ